MRVDDETSACRVVQLSSAVPSSFHSSKIVPRFDHKAVCGVKTDAASEFCCDDTNRIKVRDDVARDEGNPSNLIARDNREMCRTRS